MGHGSSLLSDVQEATKANLALIFPLRERERETKKERLRERERERQREREREKGITKRGVLPRCKTSGLC